MRKPIVAANWKMNKSVDEAMEFVSSVKLDLAGCLGCDVVLCPPFTALKVVTDMVTGTYIKVGAQNMHWESNGAFTGEISPTMLRDVYCHYVILGHSERRTLFQETDDTICRKVKAAMAATLHPILCVGETLNERETGATRDVIETQLRQGLAGITIGMSDIIIAYEPVWAIGTGRTATPELAQEAHAFIRSVLKSLSDERVAAAIRIQYGGSVKPGNAMELFSQPDIDGGLIGGASLEVRSFVEIVRAAEAARAVS